MPKRKHKEPKQSLHELLADLDAENYSHSQKVLSLLKKIDRLVGFKEE